MQFGVFQTFVNGSILGVSWIFLFLTLSFAWSVISNSPNPNPKFIFDWCEPLCPWLDNFAPFCEETTQMSSHCWTFSNFASEHPNIKVTFGIHIKRFVNKLASSEDMRAFSEILNYQLPTHWLSDWPTDRGTEQCPLQFARFSYIFLGIPGMMKSWRQYQ